MDAPLTGVVPVVPTVFRDDESVDLDGTVRVVPFPSRSQQPPWLAWSAGRERSSVTRQR